jgi:endonuclease/exonuclease/phosphatase family metal-dependent hydrolase
MVMRFRVVTLNLEQDHKRWDERSSLVVEGMKVLQPDVIALNEVSIARQTARELQRNIGSVRGIDYNLVQQTRVNGLASVEGEALLTRFAVVETGTSTSRRAIWWRKSPAFSWMASRWMST